MLIIFDSVSKHSQVTFCLFKLVTGIPCPGCGMGRATLELLKGNIVSSFHYNILCVPFSLIIFLSLLCLFSDIITKKERFFQFVNQDFGKHIRLILIILICLDWTLNIIRHV